MLYFNRRIHFDDLLLDVNDNVYEPAEDSFFFATNLIIKPDQVVLDLGTGSGILAIIAAKKAQYVLAVDLNPYAIRCAKENAELNKIQNMAFLQGDLFTALKDGTKFDLILFNAPYLPSEEGEDSTWIGRSWAGGANGRVVLDRFIPQVPSYLKPHGRVLLMQSTLTGIEKTINAFAKQKLRAVVMAEQQLPFFETLSLIEAKV
ncbi:MAG: methyltransferase domain-containing protein [Crenarchaeota archaeon]|nr:methyltransferase domain-containing protein [Thermoproteota archaeon]